MAVPRKTDSNSVDYTYMIDTPLYWSPAENDPIIWAFQTSGKINYPHIRTPYPKEKPVSTEQDQIDAEVREAIAKPRRAAEIQKRVEAVGKLDVLGTAEKGTVIRFQRVYGNIVYSYAALKVDDDAWYMTGSSHGLGGGAITWEKLLTWFTTGPNLVSDVQVANGWDTVL